MEHGGGGLVEGEDARVVHVRVQRHGVVLPGHHEVGEAFGAPVDLAGDVED